MIKRYTDTAYPVLNSRFSAKTLRETYTPTLEELALISRFHKPMLKIGFLLHLKLYQRLGYVMVLDQVPKALVRHISKFIPHVLTLDDEQLIAYDHSASKHRHIQQIRSYLGTKVLSEADRAWLVQIAEKAAETKDIVEDIVNVMLEELVHHSFELPGLTVLMQIARQARTKVNEQCYLTITQQLSDADKARIDEVLQPPGRDNYSSWQMVKREPKKPSTQEIRRYLQHVLWMRELSLGLPRFRIPVAKLSQFTLEARALNVAEMNALPALKRYALAIVLIQSQHGKALDDVGNFLIKMMRGIKQTAENRYQTYILEHQNRTDSIVGKFKEVLVAWQQERPWEERFKALEKIIDPDAEKYEAECDAHMAYAGKNYYPFMLEGYRDKRSLLLRCLEVLRLKSSSHDKTTERLISLLFALDKSRSEHLPAHQLESLLGEPLSAQWFGAKWWKLIVVEQGKDGRLFHRKYLELAILTVVKKELEALDLYIEDAAQLHDYQEQLVDDETLYAELKTYGELVGLELSDPEQFVEQLKCSLEKIANEVDVAFPDNVYADIQKDRLILHKKKRKKPSADLLAVDEQMTRDLTTISITDVLTDVSKWLNLHQHFYPHSGHHSKLEDVEKRFIMTLFCYGCNLGPSQTARSIKGIDRRQIAWMNLKQVSEDKLEKAITQVINAYNKLDLPGYWGTGKSAAADGTKWELYEQNMMSEYHIRHGGYGGIGYYHVSDKYIALFSHFIPCGVYEGAYILDIINGNQSDIQPDTLHGDTHSQNYAVFGLAHLLGINLMPRIRSIQDLHFFRPGSDSKYQNIDSLFTETIDFEPIKNHLLDMLRIVISIKRGNLTPSTILRRLSTYSRKNKLYTAFRELGKVIRTIFLLRYIHDIDLRHIIHAATNKNEEYNNFAQWLFFGGEGVIAENIRHEQRKVIKYNQLVANMVILHNTVRMTKTLKKLSGEEIGRAHV